MSSKAPNQDLKDMDFLCTFKIKRERANILNMGVSETSDHIVINIKMPNPSQEPPVSSKTPNHDLQDMSVLYTFKIKLESQNFEHRCIKDQLPYPNQNQDDKPESGTSRTPQKPHLRTILESRSRWQTAVRNLQCQL